MGWDWLTQMGSLPDWPIAAVLLKWPGWHHDYHGIITSGCGHILPAGLQTGLERGGGSVMRPEFPGDNL